MWVVAITILAILLFEASVEYCLLSIDITAKKDFCSAAYPKLKTDCYAAKTGIAAITITTASACIAVTTHPQTSNAANSISLGYDDSVWQFC